MLGFVGTGDTAIVHSMDRLARNLDDLRGLVAKLETVTFRGRLTPTAPAGTRSGQPGHAPRPRPLKPPQLCDGLRLQVSRPCSPMAVVRVVVRWVRG